MINSIDRNKIQRIALEKKHNMMKKNVWSIEERKFLSPMYTVRIDNEKVKQLLLDLGLENTFANKEQYQNCMKMIIGNRMKADNWIAWSRDAASYTKTFTDSKPQWYNIRVVLRTIEALIKAEMISSDSFNLSKKLKQDKGIASMFLYTVKFLDLLDSSFTKEELKVVKDNLFVLKEDTTNLLSSTQNTFHQLTKPTDFYFLNGSYAGTQTRYRKTDEQGNAYGRLINSLVIIPKSLANELDLGDNKGNAYLDFSGMFLSMKLVQEGKIKSLLEDDIYSPLSSTQNTFVLDRSVIKKIVNTSLFSKNIYITTSSVNNQINKENLKIEKESEKIKNITSNDVARVLNRFPNSFFFTTDNLNLFSLEGEIGTKIVEKCKTLDIQVFDKYDGFVCALKYKNQVQTIMEDAFKEVMKTSITPKIKVVEHINIIETPTMPLEAIASQDDVLVALDQSNDILEPARDLENDIENHIGTPVVKALNRIVPQSEIDRMRLSDSKKETLEDIWSQL